MVPGVPGAIWRRRVDGDLPPRLLAAIAPGPGIESTEDSLLFGLPGIARYFVRRGSTIDFAPHESADLDAVHLHLNGSARGVLIQQRGELALDAATLKAPDGRCVAIAGRSGAGKSTLAAALCRRGWSLVADAITRVTWNGTNAIAWPSDRAVRLWRDACERLGADPAALKRVRSGLEKYELPVRADDEPAILSHIVQLLPVPGIGLAETAEAERAGVLAATGFRPHLVALFGARERHRQMVAEVAAACRIYALRGARAADADELAAIIQGIGQ